MVLALALVLLPTTAQPRPCQQEWRTRSGTRGELTGGGTPTQTSQQEQTQSCAAILPSPPPFPSPPHTHNTTTPHTEKAQSDLFLIYHPPLLAAISYRFSYRFSHRLPPSIPRPSYPTSRIPHPVSRILLMMDVGTSLLFPTPHHTTPNGGLVKNSPSQLEVGGTMGVAWWSRAATTSATTTWYR